MAATWKDDELTALTGRLRKVGTGSSTVSADAPESFTKVANVPTVNMPSVYHAETVRKSSRASAITSGSLTGSGVALPPNVDGRAALGDPRRPATAAVPLTVSFMDTAHSSRRLRDPASIESQHAAALSENPRAFAMCSGIASRYIGTSMTQNYMTATQVAQQRLTSLEDTLQRMQLHESRPVLHTGGSSRASALASTAASSHTHPRYDGVAGGYNTRGRAGMTGPGWGIDDLTMQQMDRSLTAAMTWKPSSVSSQQAMATSNAIADGSAITLTVPPPTPMLALQAAPGAFLSRSSARGVNPRLHMSGLQDALGQFVSDKVTEAAVPGGMGGTQTSGTFTLQPTPLRPDSMRRGTSALTSRSRGPNKESQEQNDSVNAQHELEHAWIGLHPRDIMVSRMGAGEELVRNAALQARSVARQAPAITVDLTHKFITTGQWATMNFSGNTRSPPQGRRPLMPSPTRSNQAVLPPQSPGFAPDGGEVTKAGFAATGVTAFGDEQAGRQPSGLSDAPGGEDALRMGALPLSRAANFRAELSELDAFEASHGLRATPDTWPRKVLIAKISASGLAHEVGLGNPAALYTADKATLLNAFERLDDAARRQAVYGPLRPRSDPSAFTIHGPLTHGPGIPVRLETLGRRVAGLPVGPGTGSFGEPSRAAYSAGVGARVHPPPGRRAFNTRQEDVDMLVSMGQ